MSSILNDVKAVVGLTDSQVEFDTQLVLHINTALAVLNQLGVGPTTGLEISDSSTEWDDLFSDSNLNNVKSYVYLWVKREFDPPQAGFVLLSIDRQLEELAYRINVVVDYP